MPYRGGLMGRSVSGGLIVEIETSSPMGTVVGGLIFNHLNLLI